MRSLLTERFINLPNQRKNNPPLILSGWFSLFPFRYQVHRKRPKSRKSVARINIMFDHIKCKVIETAKAPDRYSQQQNNLEIRVLEDQHQVKNDSYIK